MYSFQFSNYLISIQFFYASGKTRAQIDFGTGTSILLLLLGVGAGAEISFCSPSDGDTFDKVAEFVVTEAVVH